MFTGLIEEVGHIDCAGPRTRVICSRILDGLRDGDSISVNGVCLTAVATDPQGFSADLAPETLQRTTLGSLHAGDPVNLERSLRADQRLGGHIVQGHIDGTAKVLAMDELRDGNWWLKVRLTPELDRYAVFKGSIAIDGISLTIASLEDGTLGVTIIPHTLQHTSLRIRKPGDEVNIEVDILAKYIEKLTHGYTHPDSF